MLKAFRSFWRRHFSPDPPPRLGFLTVGFVMACGGSREEAERYNRICVEHHREWWLSGERH